MTILFLAFVMICCLVAIVDWRRGWLLAVAVGLLQDPVRKLTPGTPVVLSFSIMIVYAAIVVSAHREIQQSLHEFARRFGSITRAGFIVVIILLIAAMNGLITFGIANWLVPFVSLMIYLAPVPVVLLAYSYVQREEQIFAFFRYYAILTSIFLIGSLLEYLRIDFPALGLVAGTGDYIRHLPGIQIRLLSGFYRGPDIMGWHAATLTCIGIIMSLRKGLGLSSWPWFAVTAWGFFHCMVSGRRKAVYYVAVFGAVFCWRYFKRLKFAQVVALAFTIAVIAGVVQQLSSNESSSVYAQGAVTSRGEIGQRLEGGLAGTIDQVGVMGLGLGSATQGVRHLLGSEFDVGWQEGGLGKLAAEVGIPGILAFMFFGIVTMLTFLRLTSIGDVPGSSQIGRAALFGLFLANAANFAASAQAYSDAGLTLITAFFLGSLFAMATLDERLQLTQEQERARQPEPDVVALNA